MDFGGCHTQFVTPHALLTSVLCSRNSGLTRTISLDGRPFNIACSQIDIGNAATPMTEKMASGVPQADGSIAAEDTMDVDHVGQAVLHMAELPLESNVQFMTIMATKMPFIGRG